MTEQSPIPDKELRRLQFACSCASALGTSSDPWAAISHDGKFNDGTKELILNAIYARPSTVTELAELLELSAPTIHRHVTELLASELIQEVEVPATERASAVARYYRPNFPVVLAPDRRELQLVLEQLAGEIAAVVRGAQSSLAEAFDRTSLPNRGEPFEALLHYLYATTVRLAREELEREGTLPTWPEHSDGSRWVWWADEPIDVDNGMTEAAD